MSKKRKKENSKSSKQTLKKKKKISMSSFTQFYFVIILLFACLFLQATVGSQLLESEMYCGTEREQRDIGFHNKQK